MVFGLFLCSDHTKYRAGIQIKQIKFHLKSQLLPDEKREINSNSLPNQVGRNLSFETLSV